MTIYCDVLVPTEIRYIVKKLNNYRKYVSHNMINIERVFFYLRVDGFKKNPVILDDKQMNNKWKNAFNQ